MEVSLAKLPWLVDPPSDFRYQLKCLVQSSTDSRSAARRLAGYRLDSNQLHLLAKSVSRITAENDDAVRLGVISNCSSELLLPALSVSAIRHGVWLRTIGTAFNQVAFEAFNPESQINQARCHYVLLALDHRGLPLTATPGDTQRAAASVEAALEFTDSLRERLRSASGCTVIVQTVPQVTCSLFGSLERNIPGTWQWLIDRYNSELRARIASSSDLLLDVACIAENVGLVHWHDPVQWTLGKFPFAQEIVPLYADHVGRLIGASRGKSRKCLVLDLDNTVWGGVIGDDGLEGIVLGNGNPVGEAFLQVQQIALALRERGIVLAVSSKNDDQVARSAVRSHPDMLLREQHISVFQANWQDKATNLRAIAATLNLGLDALVLLDDNPAERAQVRQSLPEVAVPELPEDPALYGATLLAAGYFEAICFTPEDAQRAEQYKANAARAELLGAVSDMGSYLRSLEMKAVCEPFDQSSTARIAQLINKSNQFNLTTRRYTESEVVAMRRSTAARTLQIRLIDRFGDNGLIAVIICIEEGCDWLIDTWLMSCRVLNRHVEEAALNYIVACARKENVRALIGRYIRTERNAMVKDHYSKLGFMTVSEDEQSSVSRLDVASYIPFGVPIEIIEPHDGGVSACLHENASA